MDKYKEVARKWYGSVWAMNYYGGYAPHDLISKIEILAKAFRWFDEQREKETCETCQFWARDGRTTRACCECPEVAQHAGTLDTTKYFGCTYHRRIAEVESKQEQPVQRPRIKSNDSGVSDLEEGSHIDDYDSDDY